MDDKNLEKKIKNIIQDMGQDIRSMWEPLYALSQILCPQIAAIANLVFQSTNQRIESNRKLFFKELDKNPRLTEEIITSDIFIERFTITHKAVMETYKEEKIRCFAKFLIGSSNDHSLDIDIYEELLKKIVELSNREMAILSKLYTYENKHLDKENAINPNVISNYWNKFIEDIHNQYYIEKEEIEAILISTSRTGCYKELTGAFRSYSGGLGTLTPIFYKIVEYIKDYDTVNQ
ncbi:hypothetical protein [Clostridioides sp. ZZV14-6345]|uniref:hypothetical protein n=1 Tax=Clostridioides sp. ZZV14-6345 TaxID=2811496 RepID=UPI001D10B02B|nr:hypothetical protein [Clostridioides sp. ZZV14-6345]